MTKKIGNILFIYPENSQQCDECGEIKKLRPYGKNNTCICFDCSKKPKNKDIVETNFKKIIHSVKTVITFEDSNDTNKT